MSNNICFLGEIRNYINIFVVEKKKQKKKKKRFIWSYEYLIIDP